MREKFVEFLKSHFGRNAESLVDTYNCMCMVRVGFCNATDADPMAMKLVDMLYSAFEAGYKAGKEGN